MSASEPASILCKKYRLNQWNTFDTKLCYIQPCSMQSSVSRAIIPQEPSLLDPSFGSCVQLWFRWIVHVVFRQFGLRYRRRTESTFTRYGVRHFREQVSLITCWCMLACMVQSDSKMQEPEFREKNCLGPAYPNLATKATENLERIETLAS